MPEPILGVHHITAIAGDPQRNLDFYTRTLSLRLVKLTVNFDDPGTYHFYFADATGNPGTVMTFFPWVNARRGRHGTGQVGVVGFYIPEDSTGYWMERLKEYDIHAAGPVERFDEEVIRLLDPDGLQVELIASRQGGKGGAPWTGGSVPGEHAIRGFASPTLLQSGFEQLAGLLTDAFGMTQVRQSGARYRFSAGEGIGSQVDVEVRPNEPFGQMGAGIVHHIAWRTRNDEQQLAWRELLVQRGLDVTPVIDRQYFHSIYFREPGGILFEIATDPPGFLTDETGETLGSGLKLPQWLEPRRDQIERVLPPLQLPEIQVRNAR